MTSFSIAAAFLLLLPLQLQSLMIPSVWAVAASAIAAAEAAASSGLCGGLSGAAAAMGSCCFLLSRWDLSFFMSASLTGFRKNSSAPSSKHLKFCEAQIFSNIQEALGTEEDLARTNTQRTCQRSLLGQGKDLVFWFQDSFDSAPFHVLFNASPNFLTTWKRPPKNEPQKKIHFFCNESFFGVSERFCEILTHHYIGIERNLSYALHPCHQDMQSMHENSMHSLPPLHYY